MTRALARSQSLLYRRHQLRRGERDRIVFSGQPQHLMQRAPTRHTLFQTHLQRQRYLDTLRDLRERLHLRLYGWCLMSTHTHVVFDPGSDVRSLQQVMQALMAVTARREVAAPRGNSSIQQWEPSFQTVRLNEESLLACVRYVDRNPVEARLVCRAEEFAWSSCRSRLGLIDCDWLDDPPGFLALADSPAERRTRYRQWLEGTQPT